MPSHILKVFLGGVGQETRLKKSINESLKPRKHTHAYTHILPAPSSLTGASSAYAQ